MSYADKVFSSNVSDILNNGQKVRVRPKWPDGTQAWVIKKFGIVNRYDLRKEFPAITLRRTAIKSAVDEVLWIYQRKSNNIHDLKPHIWDEWADEEGSIGKAYGYQIGLKNILKTVTTPNGHKTNIYMDQMESVLYDLKHDPYSRRILTSMFNFADLHEMHLQPCCWSCTFNVTDEGYDKPILNMILNQRSQDMLAANNWNVVQYAALMMMVAQVSDMIPGELVHVIADCHIYDRHVEIIKDIVGRPIYDKAPTVLLDPDIKDFNDFTPDSFTVKDYVYCDAPVPKIEIAI